MPDSNGYVAAMTTLRLRPWGTMPGNAGRDPYFELRFRVMVNLDNGYCRIGYITIA